ncbi:hypothetical protein GbCGDNIH6_8319 [Granulibacter bethesdensis]|nr:hypothetical protein GbCGDNIH6_8319 [Granulibacter bethesdensis]
MPQRLACLTPTANIQLLQATNRARPSAIAPLRVLSRIIANRSNMLWVNRSSRVTKTVSPDRKKS